jgi:tRNA threonylcarbamoyl adenosine modification protein YeaZ
MKKYLIIDTSTTDSSVCLLLGGDELIKKDVAQMNQTKELVPLIKQLLTFEQLCLQDLTGIGVSTGPGLFTGTRVGAMTAKTLGYSADIPLFPFSSFDLFKTCLPHAAIDAKCNRAHLFSRGQVSMIAHQDLCSLAGPTYVLELAPFAHLDVALTLTEKDYKKLYSQFDGQTPKSHNDVTINYNTK